MEDTVSGVVGGLSTGSLALCLAVTLSVCPLSQITERRHESVEGSHWWSNLPNYSARLGDTLATRKRSTTACQPGLPLRNDCN